ncbi:hypothetical protein JW905_06090 [bacterium]|nr:hypothetical protein [candidate division CSSED10-310 bacterium]
MLRRQGYAAFLISSGLILCSAMILEGWLRHRGYPVERIPFPHLKKGQIARYVEKHHWRLIPGSVGYTKEGFEYRINSFGMRSP